MIRQVKSLLRMRNVDRDQLLGRFESVVALIIQGKSKGVAAFMKEKHSDMYIIG